MNIGYACMTVGVPYTDFSSCRLKNASKERLNDITYHNIKILDKIVDYNIANGIRLFRISSDLIPFGSHAVNTLRWWELFQTEFDAIGKKIKDHDIRVSMHPGQYTILNSPHPLVVESAVEDLVYHNRLLDALHTDHSNKIVLHIGGLYGDKKQSIQRFITNYALLPDNIKTRLIIENDDKFYHVRDLLEIGHSLNIPVVYDNLHNRLFTDNAERSNSEWIELCAATWKQQDGTPKIHYSQHNLQKRKGSHSDTVKTDEFLHFYHSLKNKNLDIMLEVKDKNISANKCINLIHDDTSIVRLQTEWKRYHYKVMECSSRIYCEINALLKNASSYPVQEFYTLIETALEQGTSKQGLIETCLHLWEVLKNKADEKQKNAFFTKLNMFKKDKCSAQAIKNVLFRMAALQEENDLLHSYFFYI